jgi:hypothetical protein
MVEFNGLKMPVTVREIKKGNIGDIINKPKKRLKDNRWYTPPCIVIRCDEGDLFIVIEDIELIFTGVEGVRVTLGSFPIMFRW